LADVSLAMSTRDSVSGVGIGLRAEHYEYIKREQPDTPWFEVLIDNYLGHGGQIRQHLNDFSERYPLSFHGVGLSLGSCDPLNTHYLKLLKQAIDTYKPILVSDHLCWTGFQNEYSHDLLPMPYTEEAAQHIIKRINLVQDYLNTQILIENVSSYMQYQISSMSEVDFLVYVCEMADCHLLLDINNIYVSAYNHGFDAKEYLAKLPQQRIKEIHLAGYEDHGDYLLDTHSQTIHPPVWALYQQAISLYSARPTLIEWDTDIPEFSVLQQEADKAEYILKMENRHRAA